MVYKSSVSSNGGGAGSVTSVALNLPASVFTISGSPVISTGTLTATFNTQLPNTFLAGPTSGPGASFSVRTLVASDIPSLSGIYVPYTGATSSPNLGTFGILLDGLAVGIQSTNGASNVMSFSGGAGNIQIQTSGSSGQMTFGSGVIGLGSNGLVHWHSNTDGRGSGDVGFSRLAAGKLALGNASASDFTGTLALGNLGVGVSSPQTKLEVVGDQNTFIMRAPTASSYGSFRVYNDQNIATRALEVGYSGSTYASAVVTNGIVGESGYISATGAFPLQFGTSNTYRMGILANGNIGIGSSTAPASNLEIGGANTNDALRVKLTGQTPFLAQFYNTAFSAGTAVCQYFAYNVGEFRMGNPNAAGFGIYTGATGYQGPQIYINGTGDVGIGSNAGSQALNTFASPTLVALAAGRVGIATATPTSTFHIFGSFGRFVRSISALRTLDGTDSVILANGTFTVTLPTAVGIKDRMYTIKNVGAGTITVATTSAQTIFTTSAVSTLTLLTGDSYTVISDNANWAVI